MANWQVISLDTTTPQLRAPGTGDGYSFNSGSTQLGVWTTTGLGIGTASPGYKLEVASGSTDASALFNSTATNGSHIRLASSGTVKNYIGCAAGFITDGAADDLGLRAVGKISFATVGAAADMVLDASGNLGIGTTSPATRLSVDNTRSDTPGTGWFTYTNVAITSSRRGMRVDTNGGYWFDYYTGSSWSGQMVLDYRGNLGLGVTPSAWRIGEFKALQVGNGASFYGRVASGDEDKAGFSANAVFDHADNRWEYIATDSASRYDQTGGAHQWFTAASGTAGNAITFTQALTLDANVNLLLNGTTAPASGVGTFAIFNGTAPTGSVTNGCVLYTEDVSSSSELKVRDEAGNVTTLSPHNFSLIPEGASEDMAWAYYSERGGKRINVDMLKLARMVEKLTGEKLVYEA